MNEWSTTTVVAAAALAAAALLLALVVALVVSGRRTRAELAATRRAQAELLERVDALAVTSAARHPDVEAAEFVITDVGSDASVDGPDTSGPAPGRIDGRLFADIVARETVVKAASWSYGLRRALSAENRNRIRFEVRRETKRATKQRRADVKEALRQYYARQGGDAA
ncbi:hypothetical protein IEQ44_06660 [Nocardioides sp. Y6]|uniref:Uncharacterized protein n=1 Tax=Nocardioides malaquae TaxID=2773426 RepID=A0ABR9RRY5_9ACTN|nr:hypothetical protein [Nocardioides malaquae]MBE7324329.1 hypothetical protein [Nocardioides malaquae]